MSAYDPFQHLSPIFVRANLRFSLLGREYSFSNESCSLFGFSGLECLDFDPTEHIGDVVTTTVEMLHSKRFQFTTPAMITAETTTDKSYLGLKFALADAVRTRISEAITTEGYYPTNYIRKYPRIPARDTLPAMPLRSIISSQDDEFIVFDIANISPNGLLVYTENPKAGLIIPGMRITGQIEPRGDVVHSVDFAGMVCRVLMEKNPATNNIRRYSGIKLTYIPEEQKQNFLEILKAVLNNILSEDKTL